MDPRTLPNLLTVQQIVTLTGVPERTVRRAARDGRFGELPDTGRTIRVPKAAVLRWAKLDEVPA